MPPPLVLRIAYSWPQFCWFYKGMKANGPIAAFLIVLLMTNFVQGANNSPLCNKALTSFSKHAIINIFERIQNPSQRTYNERALERLFEDPELVDLATSWLTLSETLKDADFMVITFHFLVALSDIRVKYEVPIGGTRGIHKGLHLHLNLLFKVANVIEREKHIEPISRILEKYFDQENGFDMEKKDSFIEFVMNTLDSFTKELIVKSAINLAQ